MTRTLTAFFDSRSDAENARIRLEQAGIDAGRAQIVDKSHSDASTSRENGGSAHQGFWSSLKSAFMPEEDSHAYEEGMRRGGYLLCLQVEESQADDAIRILDHEGTVDFDRRQDEWRSEGWSGYARSSQGSRGSTDRRTEVVEEEHIPIVEEQLHVGKREVTRGGARVRSYVREVPVHEQISLREEHVSVERHPVSGSETATAGLGDRAFQERSIEMTETTEVPMVSKEARVAEEVVVRKTAADRVETVDDTVRRTEVEVDEGVRSEAEGRAAFAFDEKNKGMNDREQARPSEGAGATGYESTRSPEKDGSGYSGDRIDKSGL